ncbi:tRNA pseudouridine synthase B [Neokomagataea thailandica NBRC 106555]|uniref:tRNA pseudouridine synthase B n=2 Tax=Neokomagataea TaxID=1223423 RepID=A0A4Y6V9H3_9PROT|nr:MULTISPECIES: tRNA pseudouridine(55) synthase TruB [Neokomagataea]QDH25117.1 tRNA pseudouridine(55) synthase TruB [Neokomagataea tanensis]GBR52106.1 tRNA pseudouridine synthase B [Neokomagataea thailandica NBRC 106555]
MSKRRGRDIDGWLILDKPLGPTSTDMVNRLRWGFGARKAGHGGTLDPLASGVLPIAFGKATRTIPYIMDATKRYQFTLDIGESRTTDDREGEVLATSSHRPTDDAIRAVLPALTGNVMQVPPVFSALRVQGRRAYDMAREGRPPDLPPRPARIDSITLVDRPDANTAVFEVQSGKGVYMRSLARDIALACGTVGHISVLRRTRCGPFDLSHAYKIDEIALDKSTQTVDKADALPVPLLEAATALVDIPALAVTEAEGKILVWGQSLDPMMLTYPMPVQLHGSDLVWRAMIGEHVLGLCQIRDGRLRAVRMLENHEFFGEHDVDYC